MIYKSIYKPRYFGYRTVRALVDIASGIISLAISPFGLDCDLGVKFAEYNLKKDVERRRRNK